MTLKAKTKKGAQTALGSLMSFLSDHEQCGVFCLAERYLVVCVIISY